jgi:predicted DsbA family dithiol-disulfide isomerase
MRTIAKFQVFYDYECPYCKKGYEALLELLPNYPGTEIEWKPVESHPRPEDHPPHTDLCVQSYYIAEELKADMPAFHAAMFQAVAIERQNVEKPEVLANIVQGVMDKNKFLEILESGKYASIVDKNNDLAYEKEGVWYVPAFRAGTLKLDAKGGIGVTREEVKAFLDNLNS